MATSKSGAKAKSTAAKKTTAKKSTQAKTSTTKSSTKVTTKPVAVKRSVFKKATGEPNFPAIIIAEVFGTFALTAVALLTLQDIGALYVGLTFALAVLVVGGVSGAHINPAVTFGLWSARKLKLSLVPVYWVSQFVGAILAILLLGMINGSGYPLDFAHFTSLSWGVLVAELVGTAVFLFGLVAVVSNDKLQNLGKAFGIGLSLTVGLLIAGGALSTLQSAKYADYQNQQSQQLSAESNSEAAAIPSELYIKGATLNPAIALAATEHTKSQLSQVAASGDEPHYSRLGLETILGTLAGAALGANLYLLLAYVNRQQN